MTTIEILLLFSMPIGALLIGGAVYFLTTPPAR